MGSTASQPVQSTLRQEAAAISRAHEPVSTLVYFPLTQCRETPESVKNRRRVSLMSVTPGTYARCVGVGWRRPTDVTGAPVPSIQVASIARLGLSPKG
jgi:hypothetical protein